MDVDLCNAALTVMGLDPMADPAKPRGRVEQAAARMHLDIRREVLEANHWTACDKVAKVEAEEDGAVPSGFSYVGLLPADWLGMWNTTATNFAVVVVGEGETARRRIAWVGDASVTVRYSADIPYALMNPLLKRAARDKLAAVLAIVQSEKPGDRKVHEDLAVASEMKCASRDALNRREDPLFASSWDAANNLGDPYGDPRRGSW